MIPYEIEIAFKQLFARRGQTLVIISGVAMVVGIIIFIRGLNDGFYDELINKTVETSPHIRIEARENLMDEKISHLEKRFPTPICLALYDKTIERRRNIMGYEKIIRRVLTNKEVMSAAPYVEGNGIVNRGGKTYSVLIRGIIPEREQKVINIFKYLSSGSYQEIGLNGIVIGWRLSEKLKAGVGDHITITTERTQQTFKVTGIFNSGFYNRDLSEVHISLRAARQLYELGLSVSGIGIRLEDMYKANSAASVLAQRTGLRVRSWMSENAAILNELKASIKFMLILDIAFNVAAAIAILAVLIMVVMEKTREIGVLKAMGAQRYSIMSIFLVEGFIFGLIGSILGWALGIAFIYLYNLNPIAISEETYGISSMLAKVKFSYFTKGAIVTLIICTIAAVLPSYKASKVDPVHAIQRL
jgi:lipoprotein-releasing system permease protein